MDDIAQNKDKLSKVSVWAFSIGTAIGWGSFVVTTNTYLKTAGVAGSIIALLIGAAIMLVISRNYHFLMNRFANMGGIFTFTSETLGADFGFTSTWFLVLTYLAIFWANATSLPLFTKYLFGNVLKFGIKYTIFGYTIYINEAFLSISAILLTGLGCIHIRKLLSKINVALVFLFTLAITFCTAFCLLSKRNDFVSGSQFSSFSSTLPQIFKVACISPWAFIGFETISNATMDFGFSKKNSFSILSTSILVTTALYIFVLLLSSSVYPPQYASFFAYISDLDNLTGIDALPPFYAARHYMGNAGVAILFASLFALIITSFIGNVFALSRLIQSSASYGALPHALSKTIDNGIPANAIKLVTAISVFIPFLGRTAIGWIVDVTTINATIIYGFISLAAYRLAKREGIKTEKITGIVGLVIMISFALFLFLPNLLQDSIIQTQTYLLFIVWSVLGFIAFHYVVKFDKNDRFGNQSASVWGVFSTIVLLISLIWMNEIGNESIQTACDKLQSVHDASFNDAHREFIKATLNDIHVTNIQSSVFVILLFALSMIMIVSNSLIVHKQKLRAEKHISNAKEVAYRDALTGVKSKHAFVEYENSVNARLKSGEKVEFAVAVCDVNGLKQVNDNLGHKAGDDFIKNACAIICKSFKHSPVFRIGGDEFVIVLSGDDFENRKDLLSVFNALVEHNRDTGKVVIAIGCSDFLQGKDISLFTVFERADELMYARKKELKQPKAVL